MPVIEWNTDSAAHLYRRAGFGATADELTLAVRSGLAATVDRLVNYDAISNGLLDQRIDSMHLILKQPSKQSFIDIVRLWLTRMIYSARPLEERMTFFWHDHFATSVAKVGESELMLYQNNLFRSYAVGNFTKLCIDVARDPAMLFWLDNFTSVKDHPNENFARELLELFTLGRGHYTENDVMAAARAFTGWTLDRNPYPNVFMYMDDWHDHGQKSFLGQTGDLNGDDVIRIAATQLQHGRFIASKLFAWFAYDNPEAELVDRLARIYLDAGTEVRPLVIAILTSPEMYSSRALWTKVKSPIEHVVMACRQLQLQDEIPSARDHLTRQGQVLYEPPNVAGWDGGLSWIMSAALLSRMNFGNDAAADFDPLVFSVPSTVDALVDLYLIRLGPLQTDSATRRELIDYLAPSGALPQGQALMSRLRGLAHMILSLPEWQML